MRVARGGRKSKKNNFSSSLGLTIARDSHFAFASCLPNAKKITPVLQAKTQLALSCKNILIFYGICFALFLSDVFVKLRETLSPPFRPEIPKDLEECDKRYIQLMKQCWDNEPAVRPNFTDIKLQLRIMNGRKLVLLMDKCIKHWLSLLVRTKKS